MDLVAFRFQIKFGSIETFIPIPEFAHLCFSSLRERFYRNMVKPEPSTPAELLAKFLGYIASVVDPNLPSVYDFILRYTLVQFQTRYLEELEIHPFTYSLMKEDYSTIASANVEENILKNYFNAIVKSNYEIVGQPFLLSLSEPNFLVFFGEGNTSYIALLIQQHKLYEAFVYSDLLVPICEKFKVVVQKEDYAHIYPHGLDFLNWLENTDLRPEASYLFSTPVSCPLIAVTQLAHFCSMCKMMGMTPGEYNRFVLAGATGHGQGIVIALVIAMSDSWESFFQIAIKAACLMLSIGVRSSLKLQSLGIGNYWHETGEGDISSVLQVRGMSPHIVQVYVNENNKCTPENQHIEISACNGSKHVFVSGYPKSLYALLKTFRTYTVPLDLQQDPLEGVFSMLYKFVSNYVQVLPSPKYQFTCTFLPIFAPFHTHHLKDAYELIKEDLDNLGIEFSSKDLKIPVYDTHSGVNLQEYDNSPQEYSLTSRIVKLIIELPVNWEAATKNKGTAALLEIGDDSFGVFKDD